MGGLLTEDSLPTGQRIGLGEVEHHVRSQLRDPNLCDGVASEIIVPENGDSLILAVFLSLSGDGSDSLKQDFQLKLGSVLEGLEERTSERLPQYMIPDAYIHAHKIPMTTTNKTTGKLCGK